MDQKELDDKIQSLLPSFNLYVKLSKKITIPDSILNEYDSLYIRLEEINKEAKAITAIDDSFWERLLNIIEDVTDFTLEALKNIDWNQVFKVISNLLQLILLIVQNVNVNVLSNQQIQQLSGELSLIEAEGLKIGAQSLHLETSQIEDIFTELWRLLKAEKTCGALFACLPVLFNHLNKDFSKIINWIQSIANAENYDDMALSGALAVTNLYLANHHKHSYQQALKQTIDTIFQHSPLKYDITKAMQQALVFSQENGLKVPGKLEKIFREYQDVLNNEEDEILSASASH